MGKSYRDRVFKNRKRNNGRKFSLSKLFSNFNFSFNNLIKEDKNTNNVKLEKVKINNIKKENNIKIENVKKENNIKIDNIKKEPKLNKEEIKVNNIEEEKINKLIREEKKRILNEKLANENKAKVNKILNKKIAKPKIKLNVNMISNKSKEFSKIFESDKFKKVSIYSLASVAILFIVIIGIKNNPFKHQDSTTIIEADNLSNEVEEDKNNIPVINKENNDEKVENKKEEIKKDDSEKVENNKEDKKDNEENKKDNEEDNVDEEVNNEVNINPSSETSMVLLGDIMMGGNIGKKLDYVYGDAFKDIRFYTRNADLTFTNLTTLITTLDEIENPKSKYIVKKEIVNGLVSLGVDIVNVASLHMTDFDKLIFNNTVNILKKNDFGITGLKDNIYYTTSNGKKIAIISFNSSYNGIKDIYSDYGINVYDKDRFLSDIKTAKSNSDFIIAGINWGRDNKFEVTEEMKDIAKLAIDNGCNLVVGMNALGNYPIVKYNNVPIIYSLGELISDSKLYLDRASFIHKVYISKDNKVSKIEMLPIYVFENISVKNFFDYNKALSDSFLNQMNTWNDENSLNSRVEDNKVIVEFD